MAPRPIQPGDAAEPPDPSPPIFVQLGRTAIPALLLLLSTRMDRERPETYPGLQGAVDSLRALQASLAGERGAPDPSALGAILGAVESIRTWIA